METYETLLAEVTEYAISHEKKERYEHSVRTAATCAELCRRFGEDEQKGFFAGIAHDICKECGDMELISLAVKDGLPVSQIERTKLSLLHGRAAATLLQEQFGVTDPEIIEAVQHHTFGKAGMCNLAKLLYVADKIEPGREHITEKYLKKTENMSLNELVIFVLSENISYLQENGKKIAPATQELLDSLVGCK
ncbi:MAG: bis(5'-nucleosyl)-tetraphosphatase (symmetrical) YqeK [Spirochaetaceae bacterium]|nr:bis(5'-nucleosyl)-tetraphosphatase (symmetrical) YqeK [Spirochaetaceae bacterium]